MEHGTVSEQCDMLVGVVFNEQDFWYAYKLVLSYCQSIHIDLKILAVICIGHLARIHRYIPAGEVAPILQAALSSNEHKYIAGDTEGALGDIFIFCPQEFAKIKIIIEQNFKTSRQLKPNKEEIPTNNTIAVPREIEDYQQTLTRSIEILSTKTDHALLEQSLLAISAIGKKRIYELADYLYKIIDKVKVLRNNAIFTLGFQTQLHLPEFKEQSYEIFLKDADPDIKFTALQVWISYYYNSQDPMVLEELYKILVNDNYDRDLRITALNGIFEVIGRFPNTDDKIYMAPLMNCVNTEEFNERANWKDVTKFIKKYAPNALKNYPIVKKIKDVKN